MADCIKCKTEDAGLMVIACDKCNSWTHFKCANLTESQAERIINYFCDTCRDAHHPISWRKAIPTKAQRLMKAKLYWEVQAILNHKVIDSERHFEVEWKDCPVKQGSPVNVTSFEPESNLDGCLDLLQNYCLDNSLPLSEIRGLLGADPTQNGHDTRNWTSMSTILSTLSKWRSWRKVQSTLEASEWTQFGNKDQLFYLRHEAHCYVLLYISDRKIAYIADGGNLFRTHQQIAQEIKQTLKVRLISLEFDHQLGIDHCASSAVLIGLAFLKMHTQQSSFRRLSVSKRWRKRLINSLHKMKSEPVKLPPLRQRRKILSCDFCDKTYKSTEGKKLNMHIARAHKNSPIN